MTSSDVERVHAARASLEQDIGEATRRGPDVQRHETAWIDRERIEGRCELVAAAADIRLRRVDRDRGGRIDEIARLAIEPCRVALPHPDLAGEDQRLRTGARLDQTALDEQLVEPEPRGLVPGAGWTHGRIVAQPAASGLTGRPDVPYHLNDYLAAERLRREAHESSSAQPVMTLIGALIVVAVVAVMVLRA